MSRVPPGLRDLVISSPLNGAVYSKDECPETPRFSSIFRWQFATSVVEMPSIRGNILLSTSEDWSDPENAK